MNEKSAGAVVKKLRNFLIMVNPSEAPGKIGTPREATRWEGAGAFTTAYPRKTVRKKKLPKEETEAPRPGERIYIWINELRGGKGLTAVANVAEISTEVKKLLIMPQDVELRPGTLNNEKLEKLRQSGNVFEDIRTSTVCSLRFLSVKQAREIDSAIDSEFDTDASWELERQRRLGRIAQRPRQRQFSSTVRRNYDGRCAITDCSVAEALEAAHIATSSGSDDNNPRNGILLRADIHALLDAYLITFTQNRKGIEVSPKLMDPSYGFLRAVQLRFPCGAEPCQKHIDHHRKEFQRRSRSVG